MTKHLINTRDFSTEEIWRLFEEAQGYLDQKPRNDLVGKIVITIFFENSTRTLSSFEIAAKMLGASVVSLDVSRSSTKKGETLTDTAANLNTMNPSAIVVRHSQAGVPRILSNFISCSMINGGDGSHAHPTQALLDLFTITRYLKDLKGKRVAIIGDIKNSRVANSNIELLSRFGLEVVLVAPPHFLPKTKLETSHSLKSVVQNVDVLMSLRTQTERHKHPIYASLKDYASDFCITKDIIGDRDLLILHPGPVHRNIDIADDVLEDSRCKVLEQVKNGVAVRMAVLKKLIQT
ncbi:MAG: aspartate carbamoyltransferase catalytic subunit [Campylobacterales bacterium]